MPRYSLTPTTGAPVRDEVGIVCSNFKQVLAQATAGLADFAKDAIPSASETIKTDPCCRQPFD